MGKTFLCLAALIALTGASYCPTFTCDADMTTNVCASYMSGSAFKLNSNGCQSNYYCSAIATGLWAELINGSSTSSGSTYSCTAASTSGTTTSTSFTSMSCGTKLSNKNFKSGQTVISCTADTDCKLADDTYTNCMCVFKTDGTGICEADLNNDQVYGGYWNDCGASDTITDEDIAAYWTFYYLYWEYTQSTVSCMNIFHETTILSNLHTAYTGGSPSTTDGAEVLAIEVLALLAFY